jgi:hypothetical protein
MKIPNTVYLILAIISFLIFDFLFDKGSARIISGMPIFIGYLDYCFYCFLKFILTKEGVLKQ